ncbi:Pescadillo-like protein [Mitosporidium daphniae]|uniref:Pescadillo homolog n=1 Tax=Mitosporidium daphniae TaxID=1485682 RepID=A0A098VR36_9MICR|nr:Pescadillo-like protein [Mitosporidium daphniae]KGG51375.1 Pescadillo-like protein [Mitosporidium daphniae]|eukprot:XP_013237802.1 Pescadillo-like protein [Mitosporidium daphniae]
MCILKGIYPRDPKHKSKLAAGSSSLNKTYYHMKDIKHLVNDPLLSTLRKSKIFRKKIRHFHARGEWETARRYERLHKPDIPFSDIIRSRYPTFIDALKDLDDALTHVALFASLPQNAVTFLDASILRSCYRLLGEFSRYVMETHSLRKVFISIKGTYLQAEIHGETITWVVPHAFTLEIPRDVDIKVMATFLELYHSFVSFVNFKLLKEIGWGYPTTIADEDCDSNSSTGFLSISNPHAKGSIAETNFPAMSPKLSEDIIDQFHETDQVEDGEQPKAASTNEESIATSLIHQSEEKKILSTLFSNFVFFLSREVPFDVLVLCVASFGGRVGWNHGPGSPFAENDTRITHHVVDRPVLTNMFGGRKYVQPQWIFDSINSKKLLSEDLYGPTVTSLPPHLSPFADASGNDDENEQDQDAVARAYREADESDKEEDQSHELALSMMSKKKKKLYEAMQRGIRNKKTENDRLSARRRQIAGGNPPPC